MASKNKHLIIVGSGRSGTSWLAESLASQFRYRLMFEPDHPDHVPQGKFIADIWLQSPDLKHGSAKDFIKRLLKNRVDNDWIAQSSYRKFKMHLWPIIPKFFVLKFVRANLSIGYFLEHFKVPVIKIVRQPEEVIFSQMRVKFPWLLDLSIFSVQPSLASLLKEKTGIDLRTFEGAIEEKLALRWGIENALFPEIEHANYRRYFYEELRDDVSKVKEIMHFAGMEIPDNLDKILKRPSTKAHPKSEVRGHNIETKLTDIQKEKVVNILSKFPHNPYKL